VIVYGADPCCAERIPGGKDSARMIGRHRFEELSLPAKDGHYYLRPDRIKAIVNLDVILNETKKKFEIMKGKRLSLDSKAANKEDMILMKEEGIKDEDVTKVLLLVCILSYTNALLE